MQGVIKNNGMGKIKVMSLTRQKHFSYQNTVRLVRLFCKYKLNKNQKESEKQGFVVANSSNSLKKVR